VKQKAPSLLLHCHRRSDRSLFFRGKQLPVCARCTGMLLGYLAYPLMLLNLVEIGVLICLGMQLPALLDGYTQYRGWRESNNTLRVITGLLSGVGQSGLVVIGGRYLAQVVIELGWLR